MKKLTVALLILLAAAFILPSGMALAEKQAAPPPATAPAQPEAFDVSLVKSLLLFIEIGVREETGYETEIKYQSLTVENGVLLIGGFTMSVKYPKKPTMLRIDKIALSDLRPKLSSPASFGCSATLEGISGSIDPELTISAKLVQWRNLTVSLDEDAASVEFLKVLEFTAQAEGDSLKIASAEVTGFELTKEQIISLASGSVQGLAYSEAGDDPKKPDVTLEIVQASVKGLYFSEDDEKAKVDEAQVSGVKFREDDDTFSLGSFDLKKLDVDGNDHALLRSLKVTDVAYFEMGPKGPENGGKLASFVLVGVDLAKLNDPATYSIGKFEMRGLNIMVDSAELMTLTRFATTSSKDAKMVRGLFVLDALKLNGSALPPEAGMFLKALGHDSVTFNMRVEADLIHAQQILDIKQFAVWSDQMGRMDYTLKMGGFKVDPQNAMMSAMQMQQQAMLIGATASYVDKGLAPALIKMGAKDAKQTPEQFTQTLVGQLNMMASPKASQAVKDIIAELVKFVQSPGEIHLTAKPAKPVKIADMEQMGPDQGVAALGITAVAKPAKK